MQRLKIVTSRVWRHRVTWRHRWRHQSTRRRHFPMWSLLDTYPLNRLVSEILASKLPTHRETRRLKKVRSIQ